MPCFGISVWYVMFASTWLLSHPSQAGLCVWPNFFFFLKQKESIGNVSKSFITKRHWSLNGGQEFSWLLIHIEDRRLWGYCWGCFYYWAEHSGSLFVCIQSLATICFLAVYSTWWRKKRRNKESIWKSRFVMKSWCVLHSIHESIVCVWWIYA